MSNMDKLASEFKSLINESDARKPKPYDTDAKVVRVEGDTLWVHIPGGVEETPIKKTINAMAGDKVKVHIADGQAWVSGNETAPPTDDRQANIAKTIAIKADGKADEAIEDADRARLAADAAEGDAKRARESANSAQIDAITAKESAKIALGNLGDIENVLGTINWFAEHGEYILTEDDEVDVNKTYYRAEAGEDIEWIWQDTTKTLNGITYTVTINDEGDKVVTANGTATAKSYFCVKDTTDIPRLEAKRYRLSGGPDGGSISTYHLYLSPDPTPSEGFYYDYGNGIDFDGSDVNQYGIWIVIENGVTVNNLIFIPKLQELSSTYVPITDPTGNPAEEGYYEKSINEAVTQFINKHLTLTNNGLYIISNESDYKLLLSELGLQILDPSGDLVGLHGETIQLGKSTEVHFEATSNQLKFCTNDNDICWFGQNAEGIWEMHIANTFVEDMVRYGNYAFIKRKNGNMSLKWLGV